MKMGRALVVNLNTKTAAIVKYNKNDGCSTCGYDSSDAVSSAVVRDGTIPIPEMLRRAAILF
jgi:hypothetical protein